MRLDAVAIEADRFDRLDLDLQPLVSRRIRFGFRRPPPPTSQRAGAWGTCFSAAAVDSTVNALSVAAPSASLRRLTQAAAALE